MNQGPYLVGKTFIGGGFTSYDQSQRPLQEDQHAHRDEHDAQEEHPPVEPEHEMLGEITLWLIS